MLTEFDHVPSWFYDVKPNEIINFNQGPFVLRLKGRKSPALFVSTLLHGNEWSGIIALQSILKRHKEKNLPLEHDLILFIGNVEAAAASLRTTANNIDWNRIWKNTPVEFLPLVKRIDELVNDNKIYAAIDIHNSSGKNPNYTCICEVNAQTLNLAAMFGADIVEFKKPDSVLASRMSQFAPSVSVEAGLSGSEKGLVALENYIDDVLRLHEVSERAPHTGDFRLYASEGPIKIPESLSVSFNSKPELLKDRADFEFSSDLDLLNFVPQKRGAVIGYRREMTKELIAPDGYITYQGNKIVVQNSFIPSLISTNKNIVAKDCLGYVMREVN